MTEDLNETNTSHEGGAGRGGYNKVQVPGKMPRTLHTLTATFAILQRQKKIMTKHAVLQKEGAGPDVSHNTPPPPTYTPSSSSSDSQPPSYESVQRAISSLSIGPPDETISVPMVTRTVANSIHNYNPFSHKQGAVKQSIVVRKMKRAHYLAHYAKDGQGKFVGTGAPAPDAGLVFVPGKGSSEDMLRQAEEVAFEVQRLRGQGIGAYGMPLHDGGAGCAGFVSFGGN